MLPFAALLVVVAAVVAIARRVDARLALLLAGFALAALGGTPMLAVDAFARAMVAPMVGPICASMGFAAVLTATGCDRALVDVLVAPLRRTRLLLLPGAVVAAFVVNLAIPSQSSTAAAIGPVLVPLLVAAGRSRTAAGAALLLGASFGGDLLNPGAQDVQAVAGASAASAVAVHARVVPALLAGVVAAAFALAFALRRERADADDGTGGGTNSGTDGSAPEPRANAASEPHALRRAAMAFVPLLPVALLLLAHAGAPGLAWLVHVPDDPSWKPLAAGLPVVRAMAIGCAAATLASWRSPAPLTAAFFTGAGRAYANVISLTICAQVFGAGLGAAGLFAWLRVGEAGPGLLCVLSFAFPFALALLSGSGSGPVVAHAQTVLAPLPPGSDLDTAAALACLGGAFGRTLSPVAAVAIVAAGIAARSPQTLVRRVALPLLVGAAVATAVVAIG